MKKKKKAPIIIIIIFLLVFIAALTAVLVYRLNPSVRLNTQLKLGNKYLEDEKYEQAVAAFEVAIEIDPYNVDAYLGLADAYIELEDYDMAKSVLEDGIEIFEDEDMDREAKKLDKKLNKVLELIEEESGGKDKKDKKRDSDDDEETFGGTDITTDDQKTSGEETVADAETGDVEVTFGKDAYADLIDGYTAFYNGELTYGQTSVYRAIGDGETSIMNTGSYDHPWLGAFDNDEYFDESNTQYMYPNTLSLEAKFFDINADGVEEMFIVEFEDGNPLVHDFWTFVNGRPVLVGFYDARFALKVTYDGMLQEIGSGGWNCTTLITEKLDSNGELQEVDRLESIPGEGDSTFYEHNGQSISESEFNSMANGYYYGGGEIDFASLDGVTIGKWTR